MSAWLSFGFQTAGLLLAFNGVVQLCVRKKTGPWKEGGASLLAGAIIVGVSVFRLGATGLWLNERWFTGINILLFLMIGLVLAFNGVVQLCVRKKTGPWKEGGASLLAGAIIVGVAVFVVWLTGMSLTGTLILWCFLPAGLVLAFNGVVQLCVRKKIDPWKEGGASSLAGAIIAGVSVFWACLAEIKGLSSGFLFMGFLLAGLLLAFNGVVQLCVRKKTGPWKEGGASLLAGAIIIGVLFVLTAVGGLTSPV
jgi:predicted phage tail protein